MVLRVLRVAAIAAALAYLFDLSRLASMARGNPELPGMLWTIGVLSLLFFVGALMMEFARESTSSLQRDLLWGLSLGGVATILIRL